MPKATRSYEQFCGLALALDQVGERWALLVIRELLAGPRRFADLLSGMPGVATNTLTTRLEELEASGLIARRQLPPPAASSVYELTPRGRELEPVILAFARWGGPEIRALKANPKRAMSLSPLRSTSLALALKAYFTAPKQKLTGTLQLTLPSGNLGLSVKQNDFELTFGELMNPDAQLKSEENTIVAISTGQLDVKKAQASKLAEVHGSAAIAQQVLNCFPLGS